MAVPVIPASGKTPTFRIGNVPVYGDALLSPMDGYSDYPFRSICRELGSAMSYTEFVKSEFVVNALEHIQDRFKYAEMERPVAFQIYGDSPDQILEAAKRLLPLGPDIIDINLGCPAKSVALRGAGVGLMRTPEKIAAIFLKLSTALPIPVTGKIRLGWEQDRNYLQVARILEENGAAALAVHARTKEQGYGGQAEWDAIAEVKAAVKIPVIGNGDVKVVEDIARMKAHTGCEAVMIGRAAVGNPWIFSGIEREQVTREQVRKMVHTHLERSLEFYGPQKGLILFRKHAMQYLKIHSLPRALRTRMLQQTEAAGFLALLDENYAGQA